MPTQPVQPSKRLARMADASFDKYCAAAGEVRKKEIDESGYCFYFQSYRRYHAVKRALRLSHCDGGLGLGDERQDAEDLPTVRTFSKKFRRQRNPRMF